jgi:nucleoside-diphosphate-sugar epimerase
LATEVNYEQVEFIHSITTSSQRILYPNTNSGYGLGQGEQFCTEESPLSPISHYGRTKCDAENLLLDGGRAITLRLATVFGVSPRMRLDLLVNDFTYKAVNDGYIVLFEKDFKRNFIYIRDVALTFIYLINRYDEFVGQTFNVGLSNANLTKMELALKIKEQIPNFSIQWDDFASDPDKRDYVVSNAKLEATGWRPYYSLEDGIRELISAYRIIQHNNRNFTNL